MRERVVGKRWRKLNVQHHKLSLKAGERPPKEEPVSLNCINQMHLTYFGEIHKLQVV